MISHDALLKALQTAYPAISRHEIVPLFACYMFDGQVVTAFDDSLFIRCPCELEYRGGVRGSLLLSFVSACSGNQVEFKAEDGNVEIKCGRSVFRGPEYKLSSKIKLPEASDHRWKLPASFVKGLRRCMLSIGIDPAYFWRLGVTVSIGETVEMYSYDGLVATRYCFTPKKRPPFEGVFNLPPKFVKAVLGIADSDKPKTLNASADLKNVAVEFSSGTQVGTRAIEEVEIQAYRDVFSRHASERVMGKLAAVPDDLASALKRAQVVLWKDSKHKIGEVGSGDGSEMRLKSDGMSIRLVTKSALGKVVDVFKIAGHRRVTVSAHPEPMSRVVEGCTGMYLGSEVIVLADTDSGFTHLLTLTSAPTADSDE